MAFKFGIILVLSLTCLNVSKAIKCYSGSSSPTSPSRLVEIQCQEDVVNCLKLVSSNEEGSVVDFQYQCGSHDQKENGCVKQDPSLPVYDDMDEMMDKEMSELEKDTEEQDKDREEDSEGKSSVDSFKSGDETPQVHTFPPNARISKTVRNGSKSTSRRDVNWSQEVEDKVKRSKRDASDDASQKHMFCYCDEDLCNSSTSLPGTLSLAGLSLAMLHVLSRFY